jgi:hypothetical protein
VIEHDALSRVPAPHGRIACSTCGRPGPRRAEPNFTLAPIALVNARPGFYAAVTGARHRRPAIPTSIYQLMPRNFNRPPPPPPPQIAALPISASSTPSPATTTTTITITTTGRICPGLKYSAWSFVVWSREIRLAG